MFIGAFLSVFRSVIMGVTPKVLNKKMKDIAATKKILHRKMDSPGKTSMGSNTSYKWNWKSGFEGRPALIGSWMLTSKRGCFSSEVVSSVPLWVCSGNNNDNIWVIWGERMGYGEEACVEWVLRDSGIFEIFLMCSGRMGFHQLFLGKKENRE